MDFNVKIVKSNSEKELVLSIRKEVFIRGLNIPEHMEIDHNEDLATYVLAYIDNIPVGTARWRETKIGIKLERFAVLSEYRSNGIGQKMTKFILKNFEKIDFFEKNHVCASDASSIPCTDSLCQIMKQTRQKWCSQSYSYRWRSTCKKFRAIWTKG